MIQITNLCEDSLGLLIVILLVAMSGPPRKGSGIAPPPRWPAPKSEFPSSSFWLLCIKIFDKYPALLSVRQGSHALSFLFLTNDVFFPSREFLEIRIRSSKERHAGDARRPRADTIDQLTSFIIGDKAQNAYRPRCLAFRHERVRGCILLIHKVRRGTNGLVISEPSFQHC